MRIEVEYTTNGTPRLIVDGRAGDWGMYESPNFSHDNKYVHLSDYFTGEGDKVYRVEPVESVTRTATICIYCGKRCQSQEDYETNHHELKCMEHLPERERYMNIFQTQAAHSILP